MSGERPLAAARWLRAPETRAVLDALAAGGRESRFVGGCVRDTLLDPTLDEIDLDIATQEEPERVMALLGEAGIAVVPTGLRHGTVTARLGRRSFEITTLRRDLESFGRHARVAFTTDFVADAARRDFTINAMSCDGAGRLFDPFGGRDDLHAGRVRFVGEARRRIREDFLRILRFFRFHARFGRGEPDGEALAACAAERAGIDRLSGERIRAELFKLLEARGAARAVELMTATGVMAHVLPVAPRADRLAALLALAPEADALLRLAALLRDAADAAALARVVERLRLSRREAERLERLVLGELPDPGAAAREHRRRVHRLGFEGWRDRLRLAAAVGGAPREAVEATVAALAGFRPPPFPVAGRDLLARGVPPGPELGRLLEELRDWWEAEDFAPDRAACLARLEALLAAARSRSPCREAGGPGGGAAGPRA